MNEAPKPQSTSGDSITFDYNQLYANNNQPSVETQQPSAVNEEPANSMMQQVPIVFEEEKKPAAPEVVKDVIPTFDTRALEVDDETAANEALINSMKSESQQENEQYKKNLLFILVFFGVLIVAVWFIFPILAGY